RESPPAISSAALDVLRRHAWPGNVRELRNAVERAAGMCTAGTILPEHLPPSLRAAVLAEARQASSSAPPAVAAQHQPQNLQAEMKSLERTRILEALERCGGNQSEAARRLGI